MRLTFSVVPMSLHGARCGSLARSQWPMSTGEASRGPSRSSTVLDLQPMAQTDPFETFMTAPMDGRVDGNRPLTRVFTSSRQLVEQRFCFFQVGGVETFGDAPEGHDSAVAQSANTNAQDFYRSGRCSSRSRLTGMPSPKSRSGPSRTMRPMVETSRIRSNVSMRRLCRRRLRRYGSSWAVVGFGCVQISEFPAGDFG
jgi:hypothetical protein